MKEIDQIIQYARDNKCSDIHLTSELPPVFRKNGEIIISENGRGLQDTKRVILSMLDEEQIQKVNDRIDIDFCYTMNEVNRQRVNVYYQKGQVCAAIRVIHNEIPTFEELHLPSAIQNLANLPNGLVLITGPTGSGKSTTLASLIDYMNRNRSSHIITLEDPIEYMHQHKKSIVHQREIGKDASSFSGALRSALREDPDVILVGEMRDLETISAAVTAAETGHLVLATLHTTGAANTLDRIIDAFPDEGKAQIRTQLSGVIRGIVTQQLIPLANGRGRCAAFEILLATDAISNLIRENKCFQIPSTLQTSIQEGMCTMNYDLAKLVRTGKITREDAEIKSTNKAELYRLIR